MEKSRIIEGNSMLGLKTVFYNAKNATLGYAQDNTIYINEHYSDDIGLINKHEVLHFYENSKQFRGIKKIIFNLLGEEYISELRDYYKLKYWGLYSEKQIDEGILDNEIVIDMIINNGDFPIKIDDYINDAYTTIISGKEKISLKDRRYLNVCVSTKLKQQFAELTKWEKIFANNYYGNGRGLPANRYTKYEEIRKKIDEELEKLYEIANDKNYFNISIDSEELNREFENDILSLKSQGRMQDVARKMGNKKAELNKLAKRYSEALHMEYKYIVDLIKNTNYEPAFKYLMLNETLTRTYRQEAKGKDFVTFVDKRIIGDTTKSHMNFNETVLAVIYNNVDEYSNFSSIYFAGLNALNSSIYSKNPVTLLDVNTFGKGTWIRFEGKRNKPDKYMRNAQLLSSMVQDTPWCTKQQASMHLDEGDFYLFVDNNNRARIGVKLIGDMIDEVRGIKNENAQEVEDEYRDVVLEFLSKNDRIKYGREWLEKEKWNKRLTEYIEKYNKGKLTKEDWEDIVYDLTDVSDYKAHYAQCGNRLELLEKIKNEKMLKKLIAKKYRCSPRKVFVGDVSARRIWKDKFPYEVVLGNVDLDGVSKHMDLSSLKVILGDLSGHNLELDHFDSLTYVSGSVFLCGSSIKSMNGLKNVGEIADFYGCKIEEIKNLRRIGATANFMMATIKDLSSLETIVDEARFEYAKIGDLRSLKYIHGNVALNNCEITRIGDFDCDGRVVGHGDLTKAENASEKPRSRR